jgi:hypothetical protein
LANEHRRIAQTVVPSSLTAQVDEKVARKCSAGSMAAAGQRQGGRRNRGARFTGRSGSGFQPAMVRAHSRACALSVQLEGGRELTAPQPT